MTADGLLTIALDVAFFAAFAFTLVDYLRHREKVRRVVVLVFASVAIVLAVPLVRLVVPEVGAPLGILVAPALLAQPVLVLWLASYVQPIRRAYLLGAVAALIAIMIAVAALLATRTASGSPATTALGVALVAYFAILEGGAAIGFAMAARKRGGASRSRLLVASGATALLGLAVVVLLGGGLAGDPGSEVSGVATMAGRVLALFSALGYLVAFVPPRALRRLSQQAIMFDFIRDLNALPTGSDVARIWEILAATARQASGGGGAKVVLSEATSPPAPGLRRVTFRFSSLRWPGGRFELDVGEHVLFQDDDLELIELLVDRAVRAAEREAFIVEREELISDLRAASAAKSDFLAAMSHELRTPLNAIIGFSELLAEDEQGPADGSTVRTYADHIHGSGLHLLELVNDVLDLARVEAGRLDLKPATFELDALVRQTVATMQPLADQKDLAVLLQLAPVSIEADPARTRQIVLNLLSNAVKFTDPGGEIRVSLEADDGVTLRVADTGRGIKPADIERIFEAFQQGDVDGARVRHEGTGLGLALTRQLVEAHGGEVSVRSEVGAGSEFTVRLPVTSRAAATQDGRPMLPAGKPGVLVIEDDPAARELLRVHLEGAGYGVIATASGRQGLAWLSEIHPDAVLLDILLPDLDGWEILQRLKSDPATRSIPVMVVSVLDDRQLGLALGAVDYFVKPVSRERLLEALGRLTFTTKVRSRTVTALVIDGDPDAADRYRSLLEPDGFRVIHATDAASGRRRARDDRPDLILLDALLPDVDGFELAAALRHDPETASIPIWFSTPDGLEPEAKARLNGNVQGVFERGDEALTALRGWLATGRPVPPAASAAPDGAGVGMGGQTARGPREATA